MSDGSISLGPPSGQPMVSRADRLRAEHARIGSWLAVCWRKLLLGIIVLEIPLQLDTYWHHDPEEAFFGAISGFNISLTTFCLVLLYMQWLPRAVVESQKIRISKSLLAYVALSAFSIVWASDRVLSLYDLFLLGQTFLLFVYVVNTVTTRSEIVTIMKLLLFGMLVQGGMMIATHILGREITIGPLAFKIHLESQRATGAMGSPNVAASYLALLLAPGACFLLTPMSKKFRGLAMLSLLFGSFGLFLTMSRGGWLASVFSLAACGFFAYRKQWISARLIGFVAVGLALLLIPFLPLLSTRIFGEDRGSAMSRVPLYHISALLIADQPQGVGVNNWEIAARSYADTSDLREEWFFTVHNKFLLVWAEIGLLGLLAYLAFLFSTIVEGWRTFKRDDSILSPLALGFAMAILGQMLHMNFDVFNSRIQVQMLWLIAALVLAMSHVSRNSEPVDSLAT